MRNAVSTTATVVAAGGALLLALALLAELIRRRNASSRLVVLADRILPSTMHRVALSILTVVSILIALFGPTAASADTSVRNWLTQPGITTTSTTTPTLSPIPTSTPDPEPVPKPEPEVAPAPPVAPAIAANPAMDSAAVGAPRPSAVVHSTDSQPQSHPTAPSLPTPAPTELAPPRTTVSETHYVVAPGDCLWNIAAWILGPATTNRAIDRGWREIYNTNRAVIGNNPNHISPGQTLTIPALDPTP
jgi:LysM domain.